jgi:hypothetical protein
MSKKIAVTLEVANDGEARKRVEPHHHKAGT